MCFGHLWSTAQKTLLYCFKVWFLMFPGETSFDQLVIPPSNFQVDFCLYGSQRTQAWMGTEHIWWLLKWQFLCVVLCLLRYACVSSIEWKCRSVTGGPDHICYLYNVHRTSHIVHPGSHIYYHVPIFSSYKENFHCSAITCVSTSWKLSLQSLRKRHGSCYCDHVLADNLSHGGEWEAFHSVILFHPVIHPIQTNPIHPSHL